MAFATEEEAAFENLREFYWTCHSKSYHEFGELVTAFFNEVRNMSVGSHRRRNLVLRHQLAPSIPKCIQLQLDLFQFHFI
jgi:hypothetical protein